ncbi:MAG: hypothetical protein D6761_00230 [Candidatus Dadabacteria bacterium]|nr:MAG: hypothetical protein D6761_00230 [Candidatus Dadabacteria bacterium]
MEPQGRRGQVTTVAAAISATDAAAPATGWRCDGPDVARTLYRRDRTNATATGRWAEQFTGPDVVSPAGAEQGRHATAIPTGGGRCRREAAARGRAQGWRTDRCTAAQADREPRGGGSDATAGRTAGSGEKLVNRSILRLPLLLLGAGLLIVASVVRGAAAERPYELSADRYVTVAGEPVSIRLTLSNGDERVEELRHDGKGSLRAAGSENRVEIVNGTVSQVTAQRYRFTAQKPERYRIGPAIIRTADGAVHSNTIEIIVQPPGDARYFELHRSVQPATVYEGQPFALVVTAVHGTDLRPVGWTPPRAAGIRTLIDPDQIEPVGGRTQRGDRIFQQITIAQWFVAEQAGAKTLTGARLDVEYPNRRPRRSGRPPSPFGFDSWDMFGSRTSRNSVEVPETTVTVLPLPEPPAGLRFIGAVGHLEARWDRMEQSARQWRGILRLHGRGAATALDVNEWMQQGWRIWPDAPQIRHSARGANLELDVQIPVTLVPVKSEPGSRPAWFDPEAGAWIPVPPLPVTASVAATPDDMDRIAGQPPEAAPATGGAADVALIVVQEDPGWSRWLSVRIAQAGAATATVLLLLLAVGGRLQRQRRQIIDVETLLEQACVQDTLEYWRQVEGQLAAFDDDLAVQARRLIGESLYRPEPASPREAIRTLLREAT